jgi:bifunctional N-acetylglucosamine-1-phosphate-uridyltransferase/glucosamine-1-phosphate-acetyltransferase GlmU-like protein
MARILGREDAHPWLDAAVDPASWTVLVAAAGRGTRLGFHKPKILYPVAGISILARLVQLFDCLCAAFVFVLSPDGKAAVLPEVELLLPERYKAAIQPSPEGMGDAVACGLSDVKTPNVIVVWGDQVALRPSSIEFCMRLLQGRLLPAAVCPTVLRRQPYIHFERNADGEIVRVLQQREGDVMPPEGESDAGVFFFQTEALRRQMKELSDSDQARGKKTGEQNFLPVFRLLDAVPGQLVTARIMSHEEAVGVNSPADVEYLVARGAL